MTQKSQKYKLVSMHSLLVDLQNEYDGDKGNDYFTLVILHACLNMINGKSGLDELQKWWNLGSGFVRVYVHCVIFGNPSTIWMITVLPLSM